MYLQKNSLFSYFYFFKHVAFLLNVSMNSKTIEEYYLSYVKRQTCNLNANLNKVLKALMIYLFCTIMQITLNVI